MEPRTLQSECKFGMPSTRAGQVVAFYLFDVAETIDLHAIPARIGGRTVAARLAPKPALPDDVRYEKPPLSISVNLLPRTISSRIRETRSRRCRAGSGSR